MCPRVVISSLRQQLEKPPFYHSYTSFGVWPKDHYVLLQRSTIGVCHASLHFPEQTVPACSAMVSRTNVLSCTMWFRQCTKYVTKTNHKEWCHPHSTEHDTQPIVFLISKQVIPYRTHGPGVSTPKIWFLADLSMTNHITWWNLTVFTIPTYAQTTASILTTVKSHLDGWETISHKDTSQTQHHKGWKDLYSNHNCMAMQN
jgi:hypothetical protein